MLLARTGRGGQTGAAPAGGVPDDAGSVKSQGSNKSGVASIRFSGLIVPVRTGWRAKVLRGLQNKSAERKKKLRTEVGTGGRLSGDSLGIFGPKDKFRIKVFRSIYNQAFESVLGLLIVGYLTHLALKSSAEHLDDPFYLYLDVGFNLLFTVEAALRIIALGLYKGPDSYLRNTYNRLDFIVMLSNWVFCAIELAGGQEPFRLGSLKGVQAILCFRVFKSVAASAALRHRGVVGLHDHPQTGQLRARVRPARPSRREPRRPRPSRARS